MVLLKLITGLCPFCGAEEDKTTNGKKSKRIHWCDDKRIFAVLSSIHSLGNRILTGIVYDYFKEDHPFPIPKSKLSDIIYGMAAEENNLIEILDATFDSRTYAIGLTMDGLEKLDILNDVLRNNKISRKAINDYYDHMYKNAEELIREKIEEGILINE